MSPSLRRTRRTTSSRPQPVTVTPCKENIDAQAENTSPPSGKKARHRPTTLQLTRLEDMFKRDTHPSRDQKKALGVELGMDYKTITIWFQNRRQTAKRSQPQTPDKENSDALSLSGRTKTDSGLRTVSSPSHNETLDASSSEVDSPIKRSHSKSPVKALGVVASKAMAIVTMRPFFDTLNTLTSKQKSRELVESTHGHGNGEAANDKDAGDTEPLITSENRDANSTPPPEIPTQEEIAVQEPGKDKVIRWKRLRTLEWACERQTKRRKSTKDGYIRLGSEEIQDNDHDDAAGYDDSRMDSALSLLSLASSTRVQPPNDVVMGAALLISLRNSWSGK